jgi:hypothetical protein
MRRVGQDAIDEFTKPDSPLSVMVRTRHATHLCKHTQSAHVMAHLGNG